MDQNFYSVSVFESDFLHLVDFWFDFQHSVSTWIKIFTTHQVSMKKLFLENWSCRKSRSQSINYLVNFYRKNVKATCFVLFAKVVPEKVLFIDKKIFDQNFWKKSVFESFSQNASHFESRISKASYLEPFFYSSTMFESKILERVRFRKESFTTRQISEWKCFV